MTREAKDLVLGPFPQTVIYLIAQSWCKSKLMMPIAYFSDFSEYKYQLWVLILRGRTLDPVPRVSDSLCWVGPRSLHF